VVTIEGGGGDLVVEVVLVRADVRAGGVPADDVQQREDALVC
jgi:hypothetical protein